MDSPWWWYCVNENEVKSTSASLPCHGPVTAVLLLERWWKYENWKAQRGLPAQKGGLWGLRCVWGQWGGCLGQRSRLMTVWACGYTSSLALLLSGPFSAVLRKSCCAYIFHFYLGAGKTAPIHGWRDSLGNYTCCCKALAVGCGRQWHRLRDQPAWCCRCKGR